MERRIRNSAKAVIIREGKLAAIRICNAGEAWYIQPGGGQEAGGLRGAALCD